MPPRNNSSSEVKMDNSIKFINLTNNVNDGNDVSSLQKDRYLEGVQMRVVLHKEVYFLLYPINFYIENH